MYQILFFHVKISLVTEGTKTLSLKTSFSKTSFCPSFLILSTINFTFVHFGHLIFATAWFMSKSFVDQESIITILSKAINQASKAGEDFKTSSIIT
jgi:hypothetical protein